MAVAFQNSFLSENTCLLVVDCSLLESLSFLYHLCYTWSVLLKMIRINPAVKDSQSRVKVFGQN